MKDTTLVIMAAGMGSRYGGLKQIDPVDKEGHIIMDFSIYDAVQAGFRKVVFIIKKENEADFRSAIGDRLSNQLEVSYVFQDLHNIPEGYEVPEGRVKPWGTGHAILCCKDVVDGPFAVVNADDYYGKSAFKEIYNQLVAKADDDKYQYTMVGYQLYNTLTENGHVARGVCSISPEGKLVDIEERTRIEKKGDGAAFTEDDGATWTSLGEDTIVSMNMWGLTPDFLTTLEEGFKEFFEKEVPGNPLKAEYLIPIFIGELLEHGKISVKVLKTNDTWYGMADYLAEPQEEYICFSNYPIGDKIADFVVLTSRSKMKVCIVEVKGADFKIVKANHYQGLNVHMNDAITQLKNHMEYINRNYSSFRTQIHEDKDKAINEEYSGNYLVGPRKTLLVDPQKDIDVKYIAIGGVEREDKSIEESHEIVKCKPADNLEIASWNSFVRKLDEYHGHHPVQ